MITLVNKDLFDVTTTKEVSSRGVEYCKTIFTSSVETKNQNSNDSYKRVITIATSNYDEAKGVMLDMKANTHINIVDQNKVKINSGEKVKKNTNVYLIAIPFNGILKPLDKSFDYRIYRGFILKNDRKNIEVLGKTYKKIAYLLVNPNESVYKEDHKYHKDFLEMVLETVNLETIDGGKSRTVKTTHVVTFTPDASPVYSTFIDECEPFDMSTLKNTTLFPVVQYKAPEKKERSNNQKNNEEKLDEMIEKFNRDTNTECPSDKYNKKNHK